MHFLYLNLLSTVRGCLQPWWKVAKILQCLFFTFFFFSLSFQEMLLKFKACISKGQSYPWG